MDDSRIKRIKGAHHGFLIYRGASPFTLRARRVDSRYVARCREHATGLSVAISDSSGDYGAVVVSGANRHIRPETLDNDALWENVRYLVLQNEIPEEINLLAAERAQARGIPVCLNAAPWRSVSDVLAQKITLLVVNALEAEALSEIVVEDLASALKAASALSRQFNRVVVTAGGHGVAMATRDECFVVEAREVTVVSTHGAGDRFIGTLIGALCKRRSADQALHAASEAAALLVSGKAAF